MPEAKEIREEAEVKNPCGESETESACGCGCVPPMKTQ